MTTYELETGTIMFLEVPENSKKHKLLWFGGNDNRCHIDYIFTENHGGGFTLWYKDFGGRKNYPKEGELNILGLSTDLTEEQLEEVMGKSIHTSLFPHYVNGIKPNIYCYKTALESFNSLKQSLGIVYDNKYVVLFKKKQ